MNKINQRLSVARETGFPCPTCGIPTRVIDSRPSDKGWHRRRGCPDGHRFSTHESLASETMRPSDIVSARSLIYSAAASLATLRKVLHLEGDTAVEPAPAQFWNC